MVPSAKGSVGGVGVARVLLKHQCPHFESERNEGISCGDAQMTFRPFKGERELGGAMVAMMLRAAGHPAGAGSGWEEIRWLACLEVRGEGLQAGLPVAPALVTVAPLSVPPRPRPGV